MWRDDGGTEDSDGPVITLVRFDTVETDLGENLVRSVEGVFRYLNGDDDRPPVVRHCHRRLPPGMPAARQGDFLLSHIRGISGNIVLGITDTGFFDPRLPRFVFGYGYGGRGVLSTFRFRRETGNCRQLYERLNKEIVKILALSCDIPQCSDPRCIAVYHRTMEDIDRNTIICPSCRKALGTSLRHYLEQ